ncbi:MAG: siderophore-interacting protein [Acidimicrobiia bacterium]|nr:siderophore-interacting protein [Acidimicrobiia bacterium]
MSQRAPIRREPPPFRTAFVVSNERITPRLARIRLTGPELEALTIDEPAASVRLLIPTPGDAELIIPVWNGNEFLRPDGTRPIIRTLTPRSLDGETLSLEIVLHDDGAMSHWAASVGGDEGAAISGMGRGYSIDPTAAGLLLAGDESAIPAISQLLEWIAPETDVLVIVEIADPEGRAPMPSHARAAVSWVELPTGAPPGDALVDAVESAEISDGWRVWAAGEAAAMFRIRKHLFDSVGLERKHATVRGYWKHGRTGPGSD